MIVFSQDSFGAFFKALHDRAPYDWQLRLAERAARAAWPAAIDLPTGSGKTACIDAAVFALACQRPGQCEAPRRIFFCVNRRVIVDEAYQRARRIAKKLRDAERGKDAGSPVLVEVAAALRALAGTSKDDDIPPLDVLELRGGIYRDNRWARSAAQPTVICSTIDQLGSRLLFRGYGVSPNAAPIQAALIAYNSLILLDEAHISRPFQQTLESVRAYLDPTRWAERSINTKPMTFVPMTATPTAIQKDVIRLSEKDRENESLSRRLRASKPAELVLVKEDLAKDLAQRAAELASGKPLAIGLIVNRVATARAIYEKLEADLSNVELVIGAMRPIDRDAQMERLAEFVGPKRPEVSVQSSITVATQCLEVGADYDFDILLTECASLDALRQRFGRLNRAGRPIEARAVIVATEKAVKGDADDPIYGTALAETWNWLWEHAEPLADRESAAPAGKRSKAGAKVASDRRPVDFGINAFGLLLGDDSVNRVPETLLAPAATLDAPLMLPAYVDFWCQTAPKPAPDPDIALFLHGPQQREPDVQVCWRADLGSDSALWCDTVALVPPSVAECLSVPISLARQWLEPRGGQPDDYGDALETSRAETTDLRAVAPGPPRSGLSCDVLRWAGPDRSGLVTSTADLAPGDVLVVPAETEAWKILGHIPHAKAVRNGEADEDQTSASRTLDMHAETSVRFDVAETAFLKARDRYVVRLHPSLLGKDEAFQSVLKRLDKPDDLLPASELRSLLQEALKASSEEHRLREPLTAILKKPFNVDEYPDGLGVVLTSRQRNRSSETWLLPSLDDGDDSLSRLNRDYAVTLADHTEHVVQSLARTLALLPTSIADETFAEAAERHDGGKTDPRFQALLSGLGLTDAWLIPSVKSEWLAKSRPPSLQRRRAVAQQSELPTGFRHEMVSVQLAERALGTFPGDHEARDLVLHLIAAHHGHARPFAPVVIDHEAPEIEYGGIRLSVQNRIDTPPHHLGSGIAERFWILTRRFGWWGLAYLESLLRLADQQASADEDAGKYDGDRIPEPAEIDS
jgi:CRISPR-associated endonuclease/helicase Cas3